MKKFQLILFFFTSLSAFVASGQTAVKVEDSDLHWYTNILQDQQVSDSTNKPIFAFFTGSDWCGWCHKLEKEVFQKDEFVNWANSNVVLVELDFPRNKKLPEELVRQNNELQQVFNVGGFPTIWLFYLDRDEVAKKMTINALGSLGYPGGAVPGQEAAKFISNANLILAKQGK